MSRKAIINTIFIIVLIVCMGLFAACGSDNSPSVTDVKDKSVEAVKQAESGSSEKISGKYAIDGVQGTYYLFGEDGKGIILQEGSYENAEETIDLKYDNTDRYTTYQKKQQEKDIILSTMVEGAETQNEIKYSFVSGEDKLMGAEPFNGIYKLADSDDMRTVFHNDGILDYVQDFTYEIEDNQISITQNGFAVTYTWKIKDGKILLKSDGTVVTKLVPADAE